MASSKSKHPPYPSPLTFLPPNAHKKTLIILHGRGSTAHKFAEPLLTHPVSISGTTTTLPAASPANVSKTFRDHFPNAKFVFPTAPLRRAVAFNRTLTHQWFDNWSVTEPELKEYLRAPGLRETAALLHRLLREEVAAVGAENVVLMGLSQGCAASLVTSLLWEGEPFGAIVGMCGYLPFCKGMLEFVEGVGRGDEELFDCSEDKEDMFERGSEHPGEGKSKLERAIGWLREELDLPEIGGDGFVPPIQSIPIFMGHGAEDEKVPLQIGKAALEVLDGLGIDVQWREYEKLGHWYSEDMLRDVVQFLQRLEGWGDIVNKSGM